MRPVMWCDTDLDFCTKEEEKFTMLQRFERSSAHHRTLCRMCDISSSTLGRLLCGICEPALGTNAFGVVWSCAVVNTSSICGSFGAEFGNWIGRYT